MRTGTPAAIYMKRLLLILVVTLFSVSSFADEKSGALLGALKQKIAEMGPYRVEFSVTIDGESVEGKYEVSGESYLVTTPEIVLYCDGMTKWEVHLIDREVIIDEVDPTDRTVLNNPTRLFDFLDGSYTHRYAGPALINGVNCNKIELHGVGDAYISTATGLPVRLSYRMALLGTDAVIDVAHITPHISLGAEFNYNSARYEGFEVIDFR